MARTTDTADQSGDGQQNIPNDPTRITLPFIETSLRWKGYNMRPGYYAIPGLAFTAVIAFISSTGVIPYPIHLMAGGIVFGGASAVFADRTDPEKNTPVDYARTIINYVLAKVRYPRSHADLLADPIHNVDRIEQLNDGTAIARMNDGHFSAFVYSNGEHTEKKTESAKDKLARAYTATIRKHMDTRFSIYFTTFSENTEKWVKKYREAVHSQRFAGEIWNLMRQYLWDVIEFEEVEDRIWNPRELETYIVVNVSPEDAGSEQKAKKKLKRQIASAKRVAGTANTAEAQSVGPTELALLLSKYYAGTEHQLSNEDITEDVNASVWPQTGNVDPADAEGDENDKADHRPEAVENDTDSESEARDAVAEVDDMNPNHAYADGGGSETETGSGMNLDQSVQANNRATVPGSETLKSWVASVREGVLNPIDRGKVSGEVDQLQAALSPTTFTPVHGGECLQVGDQFTRTYWLTGWPNKPTVHFLEQIQKQSGIDFDMTIRCEPDSEQNTLGAIDDEAEDISAVVSEHGENNDNYQADATASREQLYSRMYEIIEQTSATPWFLNAYITVRAGEKKALDDLEQLIDESDEDNSDLTVDVARWRDLKNKSKDIRKQIESDPSGMVAVRDYGNHPELFKSAFPAEKDHYEENSHKDRYTRTADGTIGAILPFTRDCVTDPDGVEYGRSRYHGQKIVVDQSERKGPPHKITVGNSGVGKTYDAKKKSTRFFSTTDNATVIAADTMGNFDSPVELTNGNKIELGVTSSINPLEIQETDVDDAEKLEGSPYRMAYDGFVSFIRQTIQKQGGDPSELMPAIHQATDRTYIEKSDIVPGDPSTYSKENSPDLNDFRDVVGEMISDPRSFTRGGEKVLAEEVREKASKLQRRLVVFSQSDNMSYLEAEGESHIQTGKYNWIDMEEVAREGSADKSILLPLVMRKINEAVKRADGPVWVIFDEAHYLLNSDEMVDWLQRAYRHFRQQGAGMWCLSQRPEEFANKDSVERGDGNDDKDSIRGMSSIIQWFSVPDLDDSVAQMWGMNDDQAHFVREEARPGNLGNYASGIVTFNSESEWYTFETQAGFVEDAMINYDPSDHGDFDEYMSQKIEESKNVDPVAFYQDADHQKHELNAETTSAANAGAGLIG